MINIKNYRKYFGNTLIMLLSIPMFFASCKNEEEEPKSELCDITIFLVGDRVWTVSGTDITCVYSAEEEGLLTPAITLSPGATVNPPSGETQNFFTEQGVRYTVTAENGITKKTYTAKAIRTPYSEYNILSFKVGEVEWSIRDSIISRDYGDAKPDISLTPDITLSPGATVTPAPSEAQNFYTAEGVRYTVTAENGSTKTYIAKATGNYYVTGDIIKLYSHTVGKGVAVVILGDGFDQEDCRKGGVYEYNCWKLSNLFLSMPIIRDFPTYFDIYARVDVSRDRGARDCTQTFDNCPDNAYGIGHGANYQEWNKMHENATLTAGTGDRSIIYMANGATGGFVYVNVAVYSANESNKPYWMMHEFAGHLVGGLPDLYDLGYRGDLDEEKKKSFDDNHSAGELLMLDWPTDPTQVYWKEFIGRPGYEMVGIYPARYYDPPLSFGQIQCCEETTTSVMGSRTAHYSVMERYQLWRKIHTRAGFTDISKETFIAYDVINVTDTDTTLDRYDNWTDSRIWSGN
jgi:hypothetical protein